MLTRIWPFKHFITNETPLRNRFRAQAALVEKLTKMRRAIIPQEEETAAYGTPNVSSDDREEETLSAAVRLRDQLGCLIGFMNDDMKEIFEVKRQIDTGTLTRISFNYLWLLFKPGDTILSGTTQRRAYRVLHVTGGRTILDIGDQPSTDNRSAPQTLRSWEQYEDQVLTYAQSE